MDSMRSIKRCEALVFFFYDLILLARACLQLLAVCNCKVSPAAANRTACLKLVRRNRYTFAAYAQHDSCLLVGYMKLISRQTIETHQ